MNATILALKAVLVGLVFSILRLAHPQDTKGWKEVPPAIMARAVGAALDASIAAYESDVGEEDLERLARLAFTWSYFEASWLTSPPGHNDDGAACGVMQVHPAESKGVIPPEWTCARLRADRVLGYRAGIVVLRAAIARCGSWTAGLTAYSTNGACPAKGWTIALVPQRCKAAGLTAACNLPQ